MSPEFSRSSDNGPRVTLALMPVRKYQRLSRVSSSSWNVIAGRGTEGSRSVEDFVGQPTSL